MNIDAKMLNKICVNPNTLKRSYTMIKYISLQGCKDNLAFANQCNVTHKQSQGQ
jgi:hypothetical protein